MESISRFLDSDWCDLSWGTWVSFSSPSSVFRQQLSTEGGVYKVRIEGEGSLAYIGQTGRSLRERVRTLANNTLRAERSPPWNDPHTAAAALWAWKKEEGHRYSVSVAEVSCEREERQCLEDRLLFRYRVEKGRSTLANHGHKHCCWSRPSNRSAGRAMEYTKNGLDTQAQSIPPPKINVGEKDPLLYLDIPWSTAYSLFDLPSELRGISGVYRIVQDGGPIYFGESKNLYSRLSAHAKVLHARHLLVSVCFMPDAYSFQRRERETDVIGAFYEQQGRAPIMQYRKQNKK
jgi:hypothetical protein